MVAKVNISMRTGLLERTDKEGREPRTSRSALIARAIEHWLEEHEREKRKDKRLQASLVIDKFREEFGAWDGTAEVLKWRERH
ncbi:MAG: hypothetical protein HY673_05955 [Chloroflexi bacterium]|nr:hypothetical protein [Chloroflexota bacterium]